MYHEESQGTTFDVMDIPHDLLDSRHGSAHHLVEAIAEYDDTLMEHYLAGEEIGEQELFKVHPRGHDRFSIVPVLCGSAFKNKGVQRLLDAVVEYLPSPVDMPPVEGHEMGAEDAGKVTPPRDGRRAVRRARVQDHDRPVRRQAHVLPRVLRHADVRADAAATRTPARRSASAASSRCTRTSARRSRRSTPATSPRRSASRSPRPATRCATRSIRSLLESMDLPGAGDLGRDRAQDEGRRGEARHGALAPRRGGSDVPRPHRRGDRRRRSSPGWASSTSRSSSTG